MEDENWAASVPANLKEVMDNPLGIVPEPSFKGCVGKNPAQPDFVKACKPFCEKYSLVQKTALIGGNVCSQTKVYKLIKHYQKALSQPAKNQFNDDMVKLVGIIHGSKKDLPCEPLLVKAAKPGKGLETYQAILSDKADGYDPTVFTFKKAGKRTSGNSCSTWTGRKLSK